jgi:gas vesicle protein
MALLSNEELTESMRSLERKLEQLSAPYEDALSHRIFESVQKTFRAWLTLWLGVFSLVVALVGYVGYDEVISAGKKKVEEQIANQVTTQLQDEIKGELSKAREQIKQALLESSLDDVSKLDADLAQLLSDTQTAIDQRLKEFANKLAPALKDPDLPKALAEIVKPTSLSGYAFFGIKSGNEWSERNFRVVGKGDDAYPSVGDTVVSLVPVNARSGVIELTARGWVNKPTVGLIKPGRELRISKVQTVAGGAYVWFQFSSKD